MVVGLARVVADPDQVRRFERELRPWLDRPMKQVVRVRAVTGYQPGGA